MDGNEKGPLHAAMICMNAERTKLLYCEHSHSSLIGNSTCPCCSNRCANAGINGGSDVDDDLRQFFGLAPDGGDTGAMVR